VFLRLVLLESLLPTLLFVSLSSALRSSFV